MRKLYAISLLIVLLSLAACGIDNTMYNAKNYFQSAQERPLNANGRPAPQAVSDYTKAIKKCGIILSDDDKGKRADDALYLMARALYYKGNAAFQARDAFESLIRGYPGSKHVPEAHIYLAKVMQDINQPDQAEAVLERFIRNPKYIKHHPRALLVLADFEIQDEDYHRAQFWLERIITDYRKTQEFKEAFFLFGKNYYMQGEYERSLAEFETFVGTRGIPKDKKLEARYYVALNHLELGEAEKALKEARYLVRNEVRPDLLSKARVLYGRALLANSQVEDGLYELEEVTTSYPRTETAAEAYYYWGSFLYYEQSEIDLATAHLNRVRTEYNRSTLAEIATSKATAINQTKAAPNLDSRRDLQAWLDHQYLRAESFVSPLALPDSALATYQRVIAESDTLKAIRDSLLLMIDTTSDKIDSLRTVVADSTQQAAADTSAGPAPEVTLDASSTDTLPQASAELPTPDAESAAADSLMPSVESNADTDQEQMPAVPSAPLDQSAAAADTLSSVQPTPDPVEDEPEKSQDDPKTGESSAEEEAPEPARSPELMLQELQEDVSAWQQETEEIEPLLDRFATEIIPYCYFSIFSILNDDPTQSEEAAQLHERLLTEYPRNIYSAAATALSEGRIPSLVDPDYEEASTAFDAALELYPDAPDSLVTLMQEYTQSEYPDLSLRANYRLGWYYSFEEPDTTMAREYLETVLEYPEDTEYHTAVRRFFDGKDFLLRDSGISDSTSVEADSLQTPAPESTSSSESTLIGPENINDAQEQGSAPDLSIDPEAVAEDGFELTAPAAADTLSAPEPEAQEPKSELQDPESAPQPDDDTADPEETVPQQTP